MSQAVKGDGTCAGIGAWGFWVWVYWLIGFRLEGWGLRVFRLPKCWLGDHVGLGFIRMRA